MASTRKAVDDGKAPNELIPHARPAPPDDALLHSRENLIIQPRFLASTTASEIAQGLDDGLRNLKWSEIQRMISGSKMKFFVITLNADLASSNNIVKHLWVERAAKHNARVFETGSGTVILLISAACLAHVLNGIQGHAFKVKQLVPKMYNVCFTLANINKWKPSNLLYPNVFDVIWLLTSFGAQLRPPSSGTTAIGFCAPPS